MQEPLVPADVDCTDLDGFMLNAERLMSSELVALSSHEVIGAALLLWCRAWKQRPAASLPNDDKVIAAFARMPLAKFKNLKEELLRGFVLCADGRLYHSTLGAEAVRAYAKKMAFQRKRETDAERLKNWRNSKRETPPETPNEQAHEMHCETPDETRFVAEGQGRDGTGRDDKHSLPSVESAAPTRAGAVVLRMKAEGLTAGISPSHPKLTALIDAGASDEEFADAARDAVGKGKPFAYALATVEGRRSDAAKTAGVVHRGPLRAVNKQEALEAQNRAVSERWVANMQAQARAAKEVQA